IRVGTMSVMWRAAFRSECARPCRRGAGEELTPRSSRRRGRQAMAAAEHDENQMFRRSARRIEQAVAAQAFVEDRLDQLRLGHAGQHRRAAIDLLRPEIGLEVDLEEANLAG